MLIVRPFRNEDPPRLLKLWKKTQQCQDGFSPLPTLSLNQLQTQILGLPLLDAQSVWLAFDEDTPVGYVHTIFAPSPNGYSFDPTVGQICFLCVDLEYPGASGAAAALLQAGENYLSEKGVQKIFGGSPSPSAPFYTGFYSGGEAIGFLQSDKTIINAFHEAKYQVHQKTVWFHRDLRNDSPAITAETIEHYGKFEIEIREVPTAKTWWEGCAFINGIWFDAITYLAHTERPIARLRTRIAYPDTEGVLAMYSGTWLASLMELRIHPDFAKDGVQKLLLEELIRYLISYNQIVQVESHTAEETPLFSLLHSQSWTERDTGYVFVKEL